MSEVVAIVDERNQVVGSATRREMRERMLPHRASYVFIFNSSGELYVQRRTMTKDVYPGMLDPCAGGVVLAGESYDESAARELAEEMGISGVDLTPHGEFFHEDAGSRVFGAVYSCRWDGAVVPQPEEVAGVEMIPFDQIEARAAEMTPDGIAASRLVRVP